MPYFERGNVKTYYEDVGEGEPIIANHGLSEDANYWSDTGVTTKLAEKYRVIAYDMRAHGRTVVSGEPYGYDVDTMAEDIDALADYLKLGKFHLLSHATGGMVAVRYAMKRSKRLLSLLLTDTGSATRPQFPGVTPEQFEVMWRQGAERRKTLNAEQIIEGTKANPGVFLFKMAEGPNAERGWKMYGDFVKRQDTVAISNFMASFYNDPDPHVERLRKITCPTLILLGEFDTVFIEASKLMAKEIPDNRHVVIPGVGHMTAIEATDQTVEAILGFLKTVKTKGKAK
ncbi:MAG: alpha/beta hydrolase [Dehalococcoidia bacterium]|nr:alpha/beta hydrolase [Dehalococcoidia bacterium]